MVNQCINSFLLIYHNRFPLGTRPAVSRYIHQFTDIFTEEGKKPVKVTHHVPGHHPSVRMTLGYKEREREKEQLQKAIQLQQQQQQQSTQQLSQPLVTPVNPGEIPTTVHVAPLPSSQAQPVQIQPQPPVSAVSHMFHSSA